MTSVTSTFYNLNKSPLLQFTKQKLPDPHLLPNYYAMPFVTFHAKTYTNNYPLNGQKLTANGRLTNIIWKCSNALPNVSNGCSNISNGLQKRSKKV